MADLKFGLQLELKGDQVVVRGLKNTRGEVQGFAGDVERSTRQTHQQADANKTLSQTFGTLRSVLGAVSVGYLVREFVTLTDQYNVLDQRIKTATRSTGDYNRVAKDLYAITQENGAVLRDTVSVFQQFSRSKEALGATNEEMLILTDTVQKLGVIGGSTQEELSSGLRQFGQALNSPKVQAEELNSILDQLPEVAKRIETGLGLLPGTLKAAVQEGNVLSKDIFQTLLEQAPEIAREFEEIPLSVERASTMLANSVARALGLIDDETEAMQGLAQAIKGVSEAIDGMDSSALEEFIADSIREVKVLSLHLGAVAAIIDEGLGFGGLEKSRAIIEGLKQDLIDLQMEENGRKIKRYFDDLNDLLENNALFGFGVDETTEKLKDQADATGNLSDEQKKLQEQYDANIENLEFETEWLEKELAALIAGEDALKAFNREKAIEVELRRMNAYELGPEEVARLREEIAARYDAAQAVTDYKTSLEDASAAQEAASEAAEEHKRTMERFVGEITGSFVSNLDNIGDAWDDLLERMERELLNSAIASLLGFSSPGTPILSGLGQILGVGGGSTGTGSGAGAGANLSNLTSAKSLYDLVTGGVGTIGAGFNQGVVKLAQFAGLDNPLGRGIITGAGRLTQFGGNLGFGPQTAMLGGTLASAGIGYASGMAGTALGEALFGKEAESAIGASLGAAVGTYILPGIGTAIGGLLGGMADALFGGDGKKRVALGIRTDAGAPALANAQKVTTESGLELTSYAKRAGQDGWDAANLLLQQFSAIDSTLLDLSESLFGVTGIDLAGDSLTGKAHQAGKSGGNFFGSAEFNGLSEADIRGASREFILAWTDAVNAEMGTALDFAPLLDLAAEGEDAGDALIRLNRQFAGANAILGGLNQTLFDSSVAGIEASDGLVAAFGGLENFATSAALFGDRFTSDADKMEALTDQLETQFSALNLTLPGTRDGLANLVNGLDLTTQSGQNAYAAILSASGALDTYYTALEQGVARLNTSGLDNFADEIFQNLLGSDQNRYNYAKSQADALAALIPSLTSVETINDVLADIESLSRQAYGYLDDAGQKQQGAEYLEFIEEVKLSADKAIADAQKAQTDATVVALQEGIRNASQKMATELVSALRDAAAEFSIPAAAISNAVDRFASNLTSLDGYEVNS